MGVTSADFCSVTRLDRKFHLVLFYGHVLSQVFVSAVDTSTTIYTLATSGNDNKIKIWRVFAIANGRPSRKDNSAGTSSETRFNSRLISTSLQQHYAETATIFPTLYLNTECVHSFEAHGSSVTAVKFNRSGTFLISGGFDRLIKIWNLHGNCLKTLDEHTRYINCVAINVRTKYHIKLGLLYFYHSLNLPLPHRVQMINQF